VTSVPFSDAVEEVLREFEVGLKVQEDVTGLMSRSTLNAELRRLQADIGFRRSKYNDPDYGNNQGLVPDAEADPLGIASAAQFVGNFASVLTQNLSFVSDAPTAARANDLLNSLIGK
jgi:hypothetical protein